MSESPESPAPSPTPPTIVSPVRTWVARIVYLLIIGLLAAIAIPNFMKARTTAAKSSCVANLKQIDGAIQQWALENRKTNADPVDMKEAVKFLKGGVLPICPAGGTYAPGVTVGNRPTCSLGAKADFKDGHSLP
jgi:Tfp pilus assembly protein PilE